MKINTCEIKQSLLEWFDDISNHVNVSDKYQVNEYLLGQNQMYICASSKANNVIYSHYSNIDDIDVACEIYVSDIRMSIFCRNSKAIVSLFEFLSKADKFIEIKELKNVKDVFYCSIKI